MQNYQQDCETIRRKSTTAKKRYYYQIKYHPSGEVIDSRDSDEYFETEDDAKWYAEETASAGGMGAEILT